MEKITLYDLFGYLLPGCVLNVIIGYAMHEEIYALHEKMQGDKSTLFWFGFFIFSYVEGLILSEVSGHIVRQVNKYKRNGEDKDGGTRDKQIASALSNYLQENKKEILEKLKNKDDRNFYMAALYFDIQMDSQYNRIHNYASASTMYRNLAMALVVGMLVLGGYRILTIHLTIILSIGIIALGIRSKRFAIKKKQYALVGFIGKYSGKQK